MPRRTIGQRQAYAARLQHWRTNPNNPFRNITAFREEAQARLHRMRYEPMVHKARMFQTFRKIRTLDRPYRRSRFFRKIAFKRHWKPMETRNLKRRRYN